ncbi:MAG: hypothetical protein ACRDFQ_05145 [Anaerolineales bacterium]
MKHLRLLFLLLLTACSSEQLSIRILNIPDYAATGDLEIEVCASQPLEISDLSVNLYVTENIEWSTLKNVKAYNEYFSGSFAGFPGDISNPISIDLWKPSGPNCYEATLIGIFLWTEDWHAKNRCPFKAIVIVATYRRGEMNGVRVLECHI